MNIKNERVHQLARDAAAKTGRTQTGALELALERLLAELDAQSPSSSSARRDQADQILAAIDRRLDDARRGALLSEDLYDESGLPA